MAHRPPEDAEAKRRRARKLDQATRDKLAAHRGMATWGESLVPLGQFRDAAARYGRSLDEASLAAERSAHRAARIDPTPVEGPFERIAVFGGVYNNSHGLEALLEDAHRRGAQQIYCLGDYGGFGPHPERVRPLVDQGGVLSIQGNYEQSLALGADDCNCGYADPRDNHFAAVSYGYTAERSSPAFRRWLGSHPLRRRVAVGGRELLMVHGSPRRINEFLFDSTTSDAYLEVLLEQEAADGVLCTHTGLHWHRHLPSGRDAVNVGVIGRPANDGRRDVWYAILEDRGPDLPLHVEHVPLAYDVDALVRDMRSEGLPEEFVETLETGWWTTCLEILPAKERAASRF